MRITRHLVSCLLVLPLVVFSTGCASDKAVISQANDAHKELSPAVIKDQALEGYIQAIGMRVVTVAKEMDEQGYGPKSHKKEDSQWMYQNIQFHLVNSPTLNAFTTGGTHIYLYSELFNSCKSEDEFAAVVAHEFGHIYGRHVQKGMDNRYAILGGAALAAVGGAAIAGKDNWQTGAMIGGGVGLAAGQFIGMGFTRKDEDEADKLGFDFYTRAGWDPKLFAGFFQTMIDKGYDKTPEALSDHPKLSRRVENAKRRASELPPSAKSWRRENIASQSKFNELQNRAKSFAKKVPNDRSLEAAQLMLSAFPSCVAPTDLPEQKDAQKRITDSMKKQQQQQNK